MDKIECPWCFGDGEVAEDLNEPISNNWYKRLKAAEDKVDRYEKTLMWYANGGNWWPQGHLQMDQDTIPAHIDKGQRALRALSEKDDG